MQKLVLDLSVAQILPEKINKMLSSNNLGFIGMIRTVNNILKRKLDHQKIVHENLNAESGHF